MRGLEIHSTEYGLESFQFEKQPDIFRTSKNGVINTSLFVDAEKAGISQKTIMEMANIFGWDIDFALDIREGDTFKVIYEEQFLDGEKIGDGAILAAEFINQGKQIRAVRFVSDDGFAHYYTPEGESMRKTFLRSPVDFTRISSNFNPNRLHPIYKTVRPHNGIDYAASTGTPVFSSGDGKVIASSYNAANGNYVFIQHGQKYVTKYLHLNKKSVKVGQTVRQGQVIGTVGSTGSATGPHLHYEFLVNGVHMNPRTVDLPNGEPIDANQLAEFKAATSIVLAMLDNPAVQQVASIQN
jgi:murein DD-endopeptidase MepM/ murein hydrolase activator NlpD